MKSWYVHRGGRAIGPVTRDQVASAIVAGKVHADDLFCEVDEHDWVPGSDVSEFVTLWAEIATTGDIVLESDVVPLDLDDIESVDVSELAPLPLMTGKVSRGAGSMEVTDVFARDTEPPEPPPSSPPPSPPSAPPPSRSPRSQSRPPKPVPTWKEAPFEAPPVERMIETEVFVRKPRTATKRNSKVAFGITLLVVVAAIGGSVFLLQHDVPDEEALPAEAHTMAALPPPFGEVRLGMSRDDLEALFPPREPTGDCRLPLIGRRPMVPAAPTPETQSNAHSHCADAEAVAGATRGERTRIMERAQVLAEEADFGESDLVGGFELSLAQIRGAVRADLLTDRALLDAFGQTGSRTHEAVFGLAGSLTEGSVAFLRGAGSRRVGAMLNESCEVVDETRVDAFVRGQLDSRRCRSADQAGSVLRSGGGVIAVGQVRSLRDNVSPEEPRSYRELLRSAELSERQAAFTVRVADHLDEVEAYFHGAVVLAAQRSEGTELPVWGSAIAWFADGRVSRLLLNIDDDEAIDSLQSFVLRELGPPDEDERHFASWDGRGWKAHLDRGAGLALILESD